MTNWEHPTRISLKKMTPNDSATHIAKTHKPSLSKSMAAPTLTEKKARAYNRVDGREP